MLTSTSCTVTVFHCIAAIILSLLIHTTILSGKEITLRVAHVPFTIHVGVHVPDVSVLDDLSPEKVDQIITLLHAALVHINFLHFYYSE